MDGEELKAGGRERRYKLFCHTTTEGAFIGNRELSKVLWPKKSWVKCWQDQLGRDCESEEESDPDASCG